MWLRLLIMGVTIGVMSCFPGVGWRDWVVVCTGVGLWARLEYQERVQACPNLQAHFRNVYVKSVLAAWVVLAGLTFVLTHLKS